MPFFSRLLLTIVVFLACVTAAAAQPLNSAVDAILATQQLGESKIGVYAIDLRSGEELISVNADRALIPASNMKLLTSGAFLTVLGEDYTFRTEVWRSGDSVLIVGDGDPALADPELLAEMGISVEEFLDLWAEQMVENAAGRPIQSILIDDRLFDQALVHPSWPLDQLNRWYCAEVSALNFHTNVLNIHLAPGSGGGPPRIETEPAATWLRPKNLARTTGKGSNTAWVSRDLSSNEMTVHGAVKWSTAEPVAVALHDPAMVFGRLLAEKIGALGSEAPKVRRLREHEKPRRDELILAVETPIGVALERCNVDSYNLYAEALFKKLAGEVTGTQASWASSAAVMRLVLQEKLSSARGVSVATDVVVSDGSGMSRENQVTPRLMAEWLESMANDPAAGTFVESLPVAGDEGTLRKRFRRTDLDREVRAKSGYLSGVSCLSGYVLGADKAPVVAFAVLVNDIPKKVAVRRAKEFHERIVAEIDDSLGAPTRTADAPSR